MSGLTDLQSAVASVQADLATLQTTVQDAITALKTADPDAAVETAAQALQAVDTSLKSLQENLSAAVPAAPAASTTPTT